MESQHTFSIIIPVYNGSLTIEKLVSNIIGVLSSKSIEIILVNDGSSDSSHDVCIAIQKQYPQFVKYVALAKNFGEHNAVMAGLSQCSGDYAVLMDDDFQNPPEEASKLIEIASKGDYDMVYTFSDKKRHHWFRNLGSWINDIVATVLIKKPKGLYLSSFKCLSRFAINEILRYKGPYPYIDGLALRCTLNFTTVKVRHDPRGAGTSGYTLRKLIRLWLNAFTNFSILPLRISVVMGMISMIAGLIFSFVVILWKFMYPYIPMGWSTLIIVILALSGVQLMMLGLIGEYLGRMFLVQNETPQYSIRKVYSDK